jgi:hypothetical protein
MPILSWVLAGLWLIGFGLFGKRKLSSLWNLSLLLLLAALSANRNLPMFAVASIRELNDYASRARKYLPRHLDIFRKLIICLSAGICAAVVIIGAYTIYLSAAYGNREDPYPVQAVAYLKAHPCAGNLFNDYNYGGYLIWKLPGQKVYIDGRMPTWRDARNKYLMDDYFSVLDSGSVQNSQFKKYDVACVLIGNSTDTSAMIQRLGRAHWTTAVSADGSYLFLAPQN